MERVWCDTPIAGVSSNAGGTVGQDSHRLVLKITGTRNDRGTVLIALFHGSKGFPNADSEAAARLSVPAAAGGQIAAAFGDIKAGDYAVALFHDENDNGKLDTSLGFPLEGFGTSNNPRQHWRAPSYRESRFEVARDRRETAITIQMRYLTGDDSK